MLGTANRVNSTEMTPKVMSANFRIGPFAKISMEVWNSNKYYNTFRKQHIRSYNFSDL